RVDRIIYGKLEKLFETNNLEINKREVQPMLKDILTDSNIIIKEKAVTWEESIERHRFWMGRRSGCTHPTNPRISC
ncbi:hypothetical protein GH877_30140, partial [Bacillus thuringiensis]|nr:hypothetical protein [Bacillus thuringiensis]